MKKILLIVCLLLPLITLGQSETDTAFDNLRFTAGGIFSNIPNKPGGLALGFSTEYTLSKSLLGMSIDYNLSERELSTLSFEFGAGAGTAIDKFSDLFLGISVLSLNLNPYDDGALNTAILLKVRYNKYYFESKTTIWDWRKGRDPILRENGYYGINYKFYNDFTAGIQYKLIAKGAQYLNFNLGYFF